MATEAHVEELPSLAGPEPELTKHVACPVERLIGSPNPLHVDVVREVLILIARDVHDPHAEVAIRSVEVARWHAPRCTVPSTSRSATGLGVVELDVAFAVRDGLPALLASPARGVAPR